MGYIVVIDGIDSVGKETHCNLLLEKMKDKGLNVRKISFPNYDSKACEPVKMYLNGDFGSNANEVNPYAASMLYTVDRYASFKQDWENFYLNGGIIIMDRYISSNALHQASKIDSKEEKIKYIDWLYDFECEKVGLPYPNKTIFLNMPSEFSIKLMKDRANKITGKEKKDIHEKNQEFLKKSYDNAMFISKLYNWDIIDCVDNGRLRTIEEINNDIFNILIKDMEGRNDIK